MKKHLQKYMEIEKRLQDTIYSKFLNAPLSEEDHTQIKQVDDDMLVCEFFSLMNKKVFDSLPVISGKPSFEFIDFVDVENEFIRKFAEITRQI